MHNIYPLLCFSLLISLLSCSPDPEESKSGETKTVDESGLEARVNIFPHAIIRSEPTISSDIVTTLDYGEKVTINGKSKRTSSHLGFTEQPWSRVSSPSAQGWVYSPLLLEIDQSNRHGIMIWRGLQVQLLDPADRDKCVQMTELRFPEDFQGGYFSIRGKYTEPGHGCHLQQHICLKPDGTASLHFAHQGSNGIWRRGLHSIELYWTSNYNTHNQPETENFEAENAQHLLLVNGFLIYRDAGPFIREVCVQKIVQ